MTEREIIWHKTGRVLGAYRFNYDDAGRATLEELHAAGWSPVQLANTGTGSLDGLSDVTVTAPTANQVLAYNGSIWTNAAARGASPTDAGVWTGTASRTLSAKLGEIASVKDYGAVGDGIADDGPAITAACNAIEAAGGGTLILPRGTYLYGAQVFNVNESDGIEYAVDVPILEIKNCANVTVLSHGAKLKAKSGLKFGFFNPATGLPRDSATYEDGAHAYRMMAFENIDNLTILGTTEIDGNIAGLVLGGNMVIDSVLHGKQVAGDGLWVKNCNKVYVENVYAHHCGRDGVFIWRTGLSEGDDPTPHHIVNCHGHYCGRQGASVIGGIGVLLESCSWLHTGRGGVSSPPAAGIDVEPDGADVCRDIRIVNNHVLNCAGPGLLITTADVANVSVHGGIYWGTTVAAVAVNKPYVRFYDSIIRGGVSQAFCSSDPAKATQFHRCMFDDMPHDIHGVYRPPVAIDLSGNSNGDGVLFDGCYMRARVLRAISIDNRVVNGAARPLSATVRDCTIHIDGGNLVNQDYFGNLKGCTIQNLTLITTAAPTNYHWINVDSSTITGPCPVPEKMRVYDGVTYHATAPFALRAEPPTRWMGQIAIADRVTWDPAAKGSGGAYPVWWTGTAWRLLDAQA